MFNFWRQLPAKRFKNSSNTLKLIQTFHYSSTDKTNKFPENMHILNQPTSEIIQLQLNRRTSQVGVKISNQKHTKIRKKRSNVICLMRISILQNPTKEVFNSLKLDSHCRSSPSDRRHESDLRPEFPTTTNCDEVTSCRARITRP